MARTKKETNIGRPTKYEGIKTDNDVFEFASKHPVIDCQIAEFLGIQVSTLNLWKNAHPTFMESLTKAKEIIDEKVASALFKSAVGGKKKTVLKRARMDNDTGVKKLEVVEESEEELAPNVSACIFWLKNRDPSRWKDKQEIDQRTEMKSEITITTDDENL